MCVWKLKNYKTGCSDGLVGELLRYYRLASAVICSSLVREYCSNIVGGMSYS